ncbi:MAG: acetate kinase [Bacteroidetes bacterium]|nr:acetate kinase [Bacteroidota bacterium]MBL7104053.1 acetate kinase [Bacteroidales bacterium]
MKIFVLNCGSSSVKYQLVQMPEKEVLAKGIVEKTGMKGAGIKHKRNDGTQVNTDCEIPDHNTGIQKVFEILLSEEYGSIKNIKEIDAVGHRVVHGGEDFIGSVPVNAEVIKTLEKNIDLAPLHNPPNLEGINAINKLLPDVPQVGVFDTAFHQSMPPFAYLYGLPFSLYEKYRIRKYGFHGTSHKYVSKRACEVLGKDFYKTKIITCHLGNGSSIAAVKNGKSIDTSMGLTPNEGLIMGTRMGDIDAGALLFVAAKEDMSIDEMNRLINKESGVFGISGVSSDMRELEEAAAGGHERAQLALDMFHYRVRKYIGAYAAAMGGLDILVFTGGIGENADKTREAVCQDFEFLGLEFNEEKNSGLQGKEAVISKDNSKVTVIVIPTDEEMAIAMDTYYFLIPKFQDDF